MKKILYFAIASVLFTGVSNAQVEPTAGTWKTWFISAGKDYRLQPPPTYKGEVADVIAVQQKTNAAIQQQVQYWNAGSPGYRWHEMMNSLWAVDTGRYGALANLLLGTAIYDATIVAWDTKYNYNRRRPYEVDKRIKCLVPKPESPSYPCEYSVAAGVASIIIAHFYPHLADSVNRLAHEAIASRIAAGVSFPGDTHAGFELGKKIAEIEIAATRDFVPPITWDGRVPEGPGLWRGKRPMLPLGGKNKTVVLAKASEFRPAPPPEFAKDMAEMKNYKQNFRTLSNAFYWANESWFSLELTRKIFESNLHLNPPRAARIFAIIGVGSYDGFVSCWDAKYAYWGIRPNQYDTTFRPAIMITPPFPGYPSGHAAISTVMSELMSYFFPENKKLYMRKAKECAESRFQAGIHFRTDNEVAIELGKKVAAKIIEQIKNDGADKTAYR